VIYEGVNPGERSLSSWLHPMATTLFNGSTLDGNGLEDWLLVAGTLQNGE